MQLLNFNFDFVCEIDAARNIDGTIKEFRPDVGLEDESRLNPHGRGPFCRFFIPVKWLGVICVY